MKTVKIGDTQLETSALWFGTMTFGDGADEDTSAQVYARCREAGIDTFDCANKYAGGQSERILGRLIASERDQVTITSKVGQRVAEGPLGGGLSRTHIMSQCEASLRRLQTDRIDIYFVHCFDPLVPIAETMQALHDLVEAGKVRYLGVSNWAAWQIALAEGICQQHGWTRFRVMQPMYNLLKRQVEVELLPLAAALRLGVTPYSPAAAGLLSGKYGAAASDGQSGRLSTNGRYNKRYAEPWMFRAAQAFAAQAQRLGVHPVTLAVAWVAHNPTISAPLVGARNLEQLAPSLAAADLQLDATTYQQLSALSPTPPLATDRSDEQE